ncbi:MAG: carbamoyl phosphate synthase small subunit [Spirochaetae bacterium HGW-Spirochaetae-8]|nr:MAG: carbamoyl phosphate synthase small subunit [Spirochaetae bacterium HGW-Spirochaetae-8]
MEYTYLVLEDGSIYKGVGAGVPAPMAGDLSKLTIDSAPCGEVVFNTTMGAYHEILTDPSYAGQMVVMTCPHIGNYGTDTGWDEMYSTVPPCRGLIVRDLYDGPVPPGRCSLPKTLTSWGMSAITEIDTRSLTIHIREHGACYGVLVRSADIGKDREQVVAWLQTCPPMSSRDFIAQVGTSVAQVYDAKVAGGLRFVLLDYGVKRSIIEALVDRGISVVVLPATTTAEEVLSLTPPVDAVFLSNGPGDPAVLENAIHQISKLIGKLPVLGICLGHQLIAHAIGATTSKHKFGHHGGNHPVRENGTGRVFVTAQNHGYCVESETLPPGTEVWFVNANDGTLEGLYDLERKVISVQFHPEAAPGPRDARYLFDRFIAFASGESF